MRICLALYITHLLSTLPRLVSFSAIVPSAGQVAIFIRTITCGYATAVVASVSLPLILLPHSNVVDATGCACERFLCAASLLASTVSPITHFALNVTTLLEGGETRG